MVEASTKAKSTSRARMQRGLAVETAEATTKSQADQIRSRMDAARSSQVRLKGVAEELQAAVKRGDIDQVKILNANFETASRDAKQNTADLAQAMMGLGEGFKDIGVSLKQAQEFTAEETRIPKDARESVEKKKAEVDLSRRELVEAEQMSNFLGRRDKAVAAANAKLARLQQEQATLETGVKTAEQLAEQMRRTRLEGMSLEQSLQQLKVVTQQIVEMAKGRIGEIKENLTAIEAGRVETLEDLHVFAKDVESGDKAIAQCQTELDSLRAQQGEFLQNSPEWIAKKGEIEAKVNELADIERARNKAYTLSQDGQRFLEMYRVQEQSQRGLLQFHEIWIATLEEGVRQRSTLYESHLGVIRAAADQKAMSMVDQVAVETDERLTVDAAQHLNAIRGGMLGRLESMPEQLRRLREVTEADAKSKADFDARFKKLLDAFHDNFGTASGYDDAAQFASEKTAAAQPAA